MPQLRVHVIAFRQSGGDFGAEDFAVFAAEAVEGGAEGVFADLEFFGECGVIERGAVGEVRLQSADEIAAAAFVVLRDESGEGTAEQIAHPHAIKSLVGAAGGVLGGEFAFESGEIERLEGDRAAAFERVLVAVMIGEVMTENRAQPGAQPTALREHVVKGLAVFLQQLQNEILREVCGILRPAAETAGEGVKRLPVVLAQLLKGPLPLRLVRRA